MKTEPCEFCGGELYAGARIWYDRHGDPYGVCSTCYERLLHPLRPVRPMLRVAAWAAMAAGALLILANLAGCATLEPRTERVMVDGRQATIRIDAPEAPEQCGELKNWVGCYDRGVDVVYLRTPYPANARTHELAHAAGMVHGPWRTNDLHRRKCADVIVGGGGYQAGQMICVNDAGREEVWSDRNFTKLERVVS